tara:strand:- start:1186 stop:1707 length:522 start_codon:yes stop_codon:yes gene_type:complete
MLEEALLEVSLPAGIIDNDHIVPGSITPESCQLDADWDFTGGRFDSAILSALNISTDTQDAQTPNSIATSSYGDTSSYTPTKTEDVEQSEEVIFLDALKRKVIYTLPPVAESVGRKMYIKRTDKDENNICRVLTYKDDKLDDTDGIELDAGQAVILIASSKQWHVFSFLKGNT